jgi:allophanate hydrolase subunit 1
MIVNTDQVRIGVKKFVENELAHKATGVTKFMIYFVMPGIDKQIVEYINTLQSHDMFTDMFDENKNINIDTVYERAVFAMEKSGNKLLLDKYGISLDRNDVEKIYSYIKES